MRPVLNRSAVNEFDAIEPVEPEEFFEKPKLQPELKLIVELLISRFVEGR